MVGKLRTISCFAFVLSLVLYCSILFQQTYFLEFEFLPILLFSAQALLVISVFLIVCSVLILKQKMTAEKLKIKILIPCIVILVGCISLVLYNVLACYNCYTPDEYIEDNKETVQTLFPYHDIINSEYENFDICASYVTGTKYFWLESQGGSIYGLPQHYDVRYFESLSPFMNFKFRLETDNPIIKDWAELKVISNGEILKIGNDTVIFFESDGAYGVLVKDFNKTTYATLTYAEYSNISKEDFAEEIIEQHKILKQLSKENTFFDVLLSERFE